MRTILCPNFFRLLAIAILIKGAALGQTITPIIGVTSPPPAIIPQSPSFVYDSPFILIESEGRNVITLSVPVTFTLTGGNLTQSFRVNAQLLDIAAGNVAVPLVPASTTTALQSIALTTSNRTVTKTFTLNLDPQGDLGVGKRYAVRLQVQRLVTGKTFSNVGNTRDSSSFTVVHFTYTGAPDSRLNVRGYPLGPSRFSKRFAVRTDSASNEFEVKTDFLLSRFDLGASNTPVSVRLTVMLTDDLGNNVPLEGGGVIDALSNVQNMEAFLDLTPRQPQIALRTYTARFKPVAPLDSVNRTYRARVKLEHREVTSPVSFFDDGTSPSTSLTRLLDFNGNLKFGTSPSSGISTTINTLSSLPVPAPGTFSPNPPSTATPSTNAINTSFIVSSGVVTGRPGLTYGPTPVLNVKLLPNGDAVMTDTAAPPIPVTAAVGAAPSSTVGGIRVSYEHIQLTTTGASATPTVNLPQGLGFTAARATSNGKFKSSITAPQVTLLADFTNSDSISLNDLGNDAWVFDEARPILYKVLRFNLSPAGELNFVAETAEWAHKAAFDQLDQQQNNSQHETIDMQFRLSNDGYLRFATLGGISNIAFAAAGDGSARTKAAFLPVSPGSFQTHMPPEIAVRWSGAGSQIDIVDGAVNPAASRLQTASNVAVTYSTDCHQSNCPPTASTESLSLQSQSGDVQFSPDGGLFADCSVLGNSAKRTLHWDRRLAGKPAIFSHETGEFTVASLFVPGNQLYAAAVPDAGLRAPGALLYAGFDAVGAAMVYPGSANYLLGTGAYAGANFTVTDTQGANGTLRIADMPSSAPIILAPNISKYYARASGVSGRYIAGDFPGSLRLYGYTFDFTNWEMAFLSNGSDPVPEPSRINGQVTVLKALQTTVAFTQKFKALQIGCKGALGDGEVDPTDAGTKDLTYWAGKFKPLDIRFVPTAGAKCDGSNRLLTMLVESGAANIPTPLYGSLIFKPNGNLGTLADQVDGVDGRLGLPAVVPMKGPGEEVYKLNPVSKLYFNNPESPGAPDPVNGLGFVGFGARCPVPYFEDLEVHLTTSANKDVAALVSLTSGWAEKGDVTNTFFTNINFDPTHRGFPDDSFGIKVDTYRFPLQTTPFAVTAKQSIFGIVPLAYPLKWDPTLRSFTGVAPQKVDLMVLNIQHQLKYLSAENVEISFGGAFQDVGRINLSSAAAQGVGAGQVLVEKLVDGGAAKLTNGVNQLDELVSDNIDKVIDTVVDKVTETFFDAYYDEIEKSYREKVLADPAHGGLGYDQWITNTTQGLESVFDKVQKDANGLPIVPLRHQLDDLAGGLGDAASILHQASDALGQAITAIDVVAGTYTFQGLEHDGILREVPPGPGETEAKRQIVQKLVDALVRKFAPAGFEGLINSLLDVPASSMNAELNKLLQDADPTLDRLTEVLTELKSNLITLKADIDSANGVVLDMKQIVIAASDELDHLVADLRADASAFVKRAGDAARQAPLDVAQHELDLEEILTKAELKAFLRAQLRDRLLQSGIVQQIQHVLRQKISEVRMALHLAIDEVFAKVTEICAELTKKVLAPLDEQINKALGPIADTVGAGQVDGYAHIEGDTLRRLHIDAKVQLSLPEKMNLKAYFDMMCFDSSTTNSGCRPLPGEQTVEIRLGALDVPLDWSPAPSPPAEQAAAAVPGVAPPDNQKRADIGVLFTLGRNTNIPNSPYLPTGIGGSFKLTNGEFDFKGVTISELGAAVGFGAAPDFNSVDFAYLAATARVVVSSYEGCGGIFLGKTCSLEPLTIVDPDAASVLGNPPFTGAYVYGEVWIPISEVLLGVPATCMFKISAGVGAGAFYFVEGPTVGGRITLGLSGEALCAVSVRGTVKLLGVVANGDMIFKGKGNITGTAGPCPLCLEFDQTMGLTYQRGAWSVDP